MSKRRGLTALSMLLDGHILTDPEGHRFGWTEDDHLCIIGKNLATSKDVILNNDMGLRDFFIMLDSWPETHWVEQLGGYVIKDIR